MNFPSTGPAEQVNGVFVAPSFFSRIPPNHWDPFELPPNCAWPEDQIRQLQQYLVTREDIDAQTVALFIPEFEKINPEDRRLSLLSTALAHTLSVHSVTTWLMENRDWRVLSVNYQAVELLAREFRRFVAPKLNWVDQAEFDLFNDVMNSSIRLCDLLLGRLMELAGDDATVMVYSPRGQVPHNQLPQGAIPHGPRAEAGTHSPTGLFALRSPRARQDDLIHGVRMLDICPTVLGLCDIPPAKDMDGRVLNDAFTEPILVDKVVDSWETQGPARPELPDDMKRIYWGDAMSFDAQYASKPALRIQLEHDWNRAELYLHSGRGHLSVPLLTRIYYTNPFRTDMMLVVTDALLRSGLSEEALNVMRTFVACHPRSPAGQFMAAMIARDEGREYEALDLFEESVKDNPPFAYLYFYLGEMYRNMGHLPRAIEAYQRAMEVDPNALHPHLALARTYCLMGEYEAGADAALAALAVDFSTPVGHVLLGQNAQMLGELDQARKAYETALRYEPDYVPAQQSIMVLDDDIDEEAPLASVDDITNRPTGWEVDDLRLTVHSVRDEIVAWANRYAQGFAEADRRLDVYLAANAQAIADAGGEAVAPIAGQAPPLDLSEWVIRPAMPADLPHLGWFAGQALLEPYETELFVVHQPGSDELLGLVGIRMADEFGRTVVLAAQPLSVNQSLMTGLGEEELLRMLLRAGVARAAAAGAKEATFMLPQGDEDYVSESLKQMGFVVKKHEKMMTMGMQKTAEFCRGLVERFERRKAIPDDVRPVQLKDVPMYRVDRFFRRFFDDGIGPKRQELSQDISLLIMKGDEIIAGYVGHVQGDMFLSTRFAVAEEYRGGWATALLLWKGPAYAFEQGLVTIGMYMDETVFPGMAKIARHMGGEEMRPTLTFGLKFAIPWQES